MNRMDIIINIENLGPGHGLVFESARERVKVKKREDGTLFIDGIPYFQDSAVNIVDAITPTDVYPA